MSIEVFEKMQKNMHTVTSTVMFIHDHHHFRPIESFCDRGVHLFHLNH